MPGLNVARAACERAVVRLFLWMTLLLPHWAMAQLSVSDGGTPSYSQALAVPPGVGGMSPKLSLYYAGGGVNGPLGHGWSIQGLSVITRCAATKAQDGRHGSVAYQPTDKLCLDGQRLIQTDESGNPAPQGGTNAVGVAVTTQTNDAQGLGANLYREFRTEKDIYARIRAYGYAKDDSTGASGPAYFRVWTKAGHIYEYGRGPDSATNYALIAPTGKTPIAWAVARQRDTLGNYIDFNYEQRDLPWGSGPTAGSPPTFGHEWNIREIQYSGNKIAFSYDDARTDKAEAYQLGSKKISFRRLNAITTFVNGSVNGGTAVRTTKLTYEYGPVTGRSRIRNIQECAGGLSSTRCLPATTFTYSSGADDQFGFSAGFAGSSLANRDLVTGGRGVLQADFNGDGRTDLLIWSDTPSQNELWTSNGDGGFSKNGNFNITTQNLFKSDGCYTTIVTDINGDGLPDLMRYKGPTDQTGRAACGSYGPILLYKNDGNGSFTELAYSGPTLNRVNAETTVNCGGPGCSPTQSTTSTGHTFYVMDIDGDGVADIITTTAPSYTYVFANGTNFGPDPCLSQTCTLVYKGNGDGSFTGIATNLTNISVYTHNKTNPIGRSSALVDVDGDGLADLNSVGNFPMRVMTLRSLGNGSFDVTTNSPTCSNGIDFNGDGRSDCLVPGDTGAANVLKSTNGGSSYAAVANFNLTASGQELKGTGVGVLVLDFNGDGRDDILRWKDDAAQNVLYLSNGDGTFKPSSSFNLGSGSGFLAGTQIFKSDGTAHVLVGDFTGRGAVELLRLQTLNGTAANRLLTKTDATPPDQLISATSPAGLKTTLHYVPLSNSVPTAAVSDASLGARYESDMGNASYAVPGAIELSMPMYVVATQVDESGVGSGIVKTEMSYRGLKADRYGRGMLGFRQVLRQRPGANGDPLTVDTRYVQIHPYIGVAASTSTYRSKLNATGSSTLLSSTSNVYCDQTNVGAASNSANCPVTAKVSRPYLYRSVESGQDLNSGALPTVTTQNTYNGTGDPATITVTTEGTAAGVAQTFTKTVVNTYDADTTTCSDDFQTCRWILGRLNKAVVTNTVPNSLASFSSSAGSGTYAIATAGTGPAVASPLSFVLSNCASTTPTVSPTPATYVCRLGNTGTSNATNLTYTSTSTLLVVNGPTSCAANTTDCGNVTVQSPTVAGVYAGKFSVGSAGAVVTSSNITLNVTAPNGLGVSTASFSPTSVSAGASSTFNWNTAGATAASVGCVGTEVTVTGTNTGISGSVTVGTSAATTTARCTVTASNASGAQVTGTADLTVVPTTAIAVTAASFSPTSVTAGQSSKFTWNTVNATSASVSCTGAGATATGSGINGEINVSTTSAGTATCTVTGNGAAGSTATGSASLAVTALASALTLDSAGDPVSLGTNLTPVAASGGNVFYKNTGGAALTISSAGVSGSGLSAWISSENSCSVGKILQPGERCRVYVYSQSGEGTYAGSVTVNSNGGNLTTNVSGHYKGKIALTGGGAFGDVAVGQSASQTVTVTNTASYAIYGLTATATAPYSITSNGCGSTLGAGASCSLTVAFSPTAAGSASGSSYLKLSGYYKQVWLESSGAQTESSQAGSTLEYPISLSGTGIAATPVLVVDHINPGATGWVMPAYSFSTLAIYYRNSGSVPVTINSYPVSGTMGPWTHTTTAMDSSCSVNKVLAPGQVCWVLVGWNGQPGAATATLTMNSTAGQINTALSATQKTLDVAVANNGASTSSTADMTLTITNNTIGRFQFGSPAVSLSSASGQGSWVLQSHNCPAILPANGGSCAAVVRYTAGASGAGSVTASPYGTFEYTDMFDGNGFPATIFRGGPVDARATSLTATSLAQLTLSYAGSASFGNVQTGQTVNSDLATLTNNSNLTATGVAISAPSGFGVGSSNCGTTLAPKASCSFRVTFSPTQAQAYSGAVTASAANVSSGTLSVSGTGIAPALVVDHINPGATGWVMPAYSFSTLGVYYRNSGIGPVTINGYPVSGTMGPWTHTTTAMDSSCSVNKVLAPGQKCWVLVGWNGQPGTATATLTMNSTAGQINTALSATQKTLDVAVTNNGAGTGSTADMTLTITNNTIGRFQFGSPAVSLSSASGQGSWVLQSHNCPAILSANGGSCAAVVRYTAGASGAGSVTASPYGTFEYTDMLDGNGFPATIFRGGPVDARATSLTATSLAPALTLESSGNPVSLGTNLTPIAASGGDVFYKNTGGAALTVSSAGVSGSGLIAWIGSPNNCSAGKVLQPGDRCTVYVYSQSGEGTYSGSVTVNSNGGNLTTNVSGHYKGKIALTGGGAFGDVAVGQSASQTVTVTNTASYAIYGLTATATAPYSITSNGCGSTLGAGASCSLTVAFSPTAAGAASGSSYLKFSGYYKQVWLEASGSQTESSQAGSSLEFPIALSGTGVAPAPALVVDHVNPGASGWVMPAYSRSTLGIYYRNSGNVPVTINSFPVSGTMDPWTYTTAVMDSSCVENKVLVPGQVCWVVVGWNGQPGAATATLTMNSTAGQINTALAATQKTLDVVTSAGPRTSSTADTTLTITNNTIGRFQFSSPVIRLSDTYGTGSWVLQSHNCPAVLPANGGSCTAVVRFNIPYQSGGSVLASPYGTFEWADMRDGHGFPSAEFRGGPVDAKALRLSDSWRP